MNRFVRPAALGFASALVLLTGCADARLPTATERADSAHEGPLLSLSGGGMDLDRLARFDRRPGVGADWAKAWIGPAGGRLEYQGFAIDVPAGAVQKSTQFSIKLPSDPRSQERVMADLGPHGTTFDRPVTVELPYSGTSSYGSEPQIGWWNQRLGEWEAFPTTLTADGLRMSTQTTHFSTFGSMSAFGTIPLMSGG